MNDESIYSVSDLTNLIKGRLEGAFPFVWVKGQVANVARPSSGHLYFSLKDENSSLAAVWFKSRQRATNGFDPLTGEVYEDGPRPSLADSLENGQEIICAGRLTVYEQRGVYQLVVEIGQDAGFGRLHEEFERLRRQLDSSGYFALERKRPLPCNPKKVALITAPNGAAIHDFLRIAESRGSGCSIKLYPSPVQGTAAPQKIIAAFERILADNWAEVVVLIRGGGSIDDLWAFNNEALARTIFTSPLPVLAGIGHEVDFTLSDLTADVRAATPSHAAQLLWPERKEFYRQLAEASSKLEKETHRKLSGWWSTFDILSRELLFRSPARAVQQKQENLTTAGRMLQRAGRVFLEREGTKLLSLAGRVKVVPAKLPVFFNSFAAMAEALDFAAAYSLQNKEAQWQRLAEKISMAPERLAPLETMFLTVTAELDFRGRLLLSDKERKLELLELRLAAADPCQPLARGYALVHKSQGALVTGKNQVTPGEKLLITVADGDFSVQVQGEKNGS